MRTPLFLAKLYYFNLVVNLDLVAKQKIETKRVSFTRFTFQKDYSNVSVLTEFDFLNILMIKFGGLLLNSHVTVFYG